MKNRQLLAKVQRATTKRSHLLRRTKKVRRQMRQLRARPNVHAKTNQRRQKPRRSRLLAVERARQRLFRSLKKHRRTWRKLRGLVENQAVSLGILTDCPVQQAHWGRFCRRRSLLEVAQFLETIATDPMVKLPLQDWRSWEIQDWIGTSYEVAVRRGAWRVKGQGRDFVHDAFLNSDRAFDPEQGKLAPFLSRVLGRRLNDSLRRTYRKGEHVPFDERAIPVPPPEVEMCNDERLDCFRAVLKKLPQKDVELLWLKHGLGVGNKELGARSGMSEAAMKMQTCRARRRSRNALIRRGCKSVADAESLGDRILVSPSAFPRKCPKGPVTHHPRRRRRRRNM